MIRTLLGPPPFDNPDADVILRSSDKEPVDFRVFKLLLSLSSPFFSEIFALPQPQNRSAASDEAYDHFGVPIVQMAEDQETLRLLLGLCYPISVHDTPRFSSLQELNLVISAACKFEMDGVLKYLRKELVCPRFIEAQPIRVFAIAYRYGWDAEARLAARYTLRHSVNVPFVSELELISGATLHRLQEYHRLCGEIASSRAHIQPVLVEPDDGWSWVTCKRCPTSWTQSSNYPQSRKWWMQWIANVADALREKPWGETVKNWGLLIKAVEQVSSCPKCSKEARGDLEAFSQILAVQVEKDISLIEFDLNFDEWSYASSSN